MPPAVARAAVQSLVEDIMLTRMVGLLAVFLLGSTAAWPAVIISNPSVNDGVQTIFPGVGGIDGIKGMGFTMGPSSFDLDSIELRLCFSGAAASCFPAANGSVGTPVVRLFSDVAGDPSLELFTFLNPVFGIGTADYTFLPPADFTLTTGTSYWIVVHSADGGDFSWKANDPQTIPAGAFASHLGQKVGGDAPEPPIDQSDFYNIYSVHGTLVSVPEPSSALLLVLGVAACAFARRRAPTWDSRLRAPQVSTGRATPNICSFSA